jgi:hypothetical protein
MYQTSLNTFLYPNFLRAPEVDRFLRFLNSDAWSVFSRPPRLRRSNGSRYATLRRGAIATVPGGRLGLTSGSPLVSPDSGLPARYDIIGGREKVHLQHCFAPRHRTSSNLKLPRSQWSESLLQRPTHQAQLCASLRDNWWPSYGECA